MWSRISGKFYSRSQLITLTTLIHFHNSQHITFLAQLSHMYTSRVVHIRKCWTKSFPALSFWYLDLLLDSKVSIIIFLNHLLLLLFYLINFYKSYHAAPPPTFKNFETFHSFHLESTPNFKIKSLKNPKFDTWQNYKTLALALCSIGKPFTDH